MKVLVVDDTKNIRMLLTRCLELEGYEVDSAIDGYQAIQLFMNNKYDLAFIDIKMPNFSGTEVIKKIRELGIDIPVIIITAFPTIKNAVECVQMGAIAYLQKPFTADKVKNKLSELLNEMKIKGNNNHTEIINAFNDQKRYSDSMNYLKKIISEESLNPEIYYLFHVTTKYMGQEKISEKYYKLYKSII